MKYRPYLSRVCSARLASTLSNFRPCGGLGQSVWPAITTTRAWPRLPVRSSRPRHRASRLPGSRWAGTSLLRSCGRPVIASRGSPCLTPRRAPIQPSSQSAVSTRSRWRAAVSSLTWSTFSTSAGYAPSGAATSHCSGSADETGPDAFARQQTAIMNRPDSRPGLAAISCPTLVVAGAEDNVTPPEYAKEIAGLIPGARLVVIPGCGHLSTLEEPAAVTQALADWLDQ